jgi:hypothetical protein
MLPGGASPNLNFVEKRTGAGKSKAKYAECKNKQGKEQNKGT